MRKERKNQSTQFSALQKNIGPEREVRLGLKNIKAFLSSIGNPHKKIPKAIHIAGSNGKGSTLAFLQSLLSQHPLRVGKYTSPHLKSPTERFQVDNNFIGEEELEVHLKKLSSIVGFDNLTHFEKLTAVAFNYFAEKEIDLLLLETGLGGRLDATNVIDKPTLCLITNISFDHQEFLGNSLAEIAYEKAGILKQGVSFITSVEGEALSVIQKQAASVGAPEVALQSYEIDPAKLGLKGPHQKVNALLALNAYKFLLDQQILAYEFNLDNCLKLLYSPQNWPGRFQEIVRKGRRIILDGAHNEAGAEALRNSLSSLEAGKSTIWLMGFLKNKNYTKIIHSLVKEDDCIVFTHASAAEQSADLNELKNIAKTKFPNLKIVCQENLAAAFHSFNELSQQYPQNVAVVTGSLYLLGAVLNLLDEIEKTAS